MDFNNLKIAKMEIKVLGTGCAKCKALDQVTREAVKELELDANVEKIEDIQRIMEYGVMMTPALIVNDKVILKGKVPSLKKMKSLLIK